MGERTLTAGMRATTAQAVVRPFFAVYGDFPSGEVRMWSGLGPITWDGNTYEGVGEFLAAQVVEESVDGGARGMAVSLSGLPSRVFDPVMVDAFHGRRADLYFGYLNAGGEPLADPVLLFRGQMDTDEVRDDGETVTITIRAEHRLSDLLRSREWRYTMESQHALQGATTDKGLEFVPSLQEAVIQWGQV